MKSVYLVVSDLHFSGQSKHNRYNYDKELFVVMHKIVDLITEYRSNQYKVYIIFLGDVFDRSYKSPEKYGIDSSFFFKLRQESDGLFAVCGNHEFTYYDRNPFWTLVSEIKSSRVNSLVKVNRQPLGFENIFEIRDSLEFEDCVFHFNHFGCIDSIPVIGKKNIAFYHKPIYNKVIIDDATMKGLQVEFAEHSNSYPVEVLKKYDYCFLGHMHLLYGQWKAGDCIVTYLASLGRPSKAEVLDSFLERNIPTILLDDNKFVEVRQNKFLLPSRDISVIKEVDVEESVKYEIQKVQKDAKNYISATDDPIRNIKNKIADNPDALALLNSLINKTFSDADIGAQLYNLMRRVQY